MTQAAAIKPLQMEDITGMDLSVGEILRRSRMHYKLSLSDVERELHIKPPQIEAIEGDHFERLPGKVYAIGFIRSYAEYLGLDADKMVRLFKVQGKTQTEDPALNFPVCASESKLPSAWMVIVSTLALIGVLIAWNINTSGVISAPKTTSVTQTAIPDIPERLQNAGQGGNLMKSESTPKAVSKPSNVTYGPYLSDKIKTISAAAAAEGIRVHVVQNSWVEIRNAKGKTLVSRVLKAGEQYLIPKKKGMTITIGNAGGIRLSINGQDLALVGKAGEVVRRLPLDAAYLTEKFAQ